MLDIYNAYSNAYTWIIVSLVIAIAGGIVAYFLFIYDKTRITKKLPKLRDILNGDILYIEHLVRIIYLILTIFYILSAFAYISIDFWSFIYQLIAYPVILRVIYELVITFLRIGKNVKEIADNTKKK